MFCHLQGHLLHLLHLLLLACRRSSLHCHYCALPERIQAQSVSRSCPLSFSVPISGTEIGPKSVTHTSQHGKTFNTVRGLHVANTHTHPEPTHIHTHTHARRHKSCWRSGAYACDKPSSATLLSAPCSEGVLLQSARRAKESSKPPDPNAVARRSDHPAVGRSGDEVPLVCTPFARSLALSQLSLPKRPTAASCSARIRDPTTADCRARARLPLRWNGAEPAGCGRLVRTALSVQVGGVAFCGVGRTDLRCKLLCWAVACDWFGQLMPSRSVHRRDIGALR